MLLWDHCRSVDCNAGLDEAAIDALAEAFLLEQTKFDIDFEIHDALGKLARLGLLNVDPQGRWSPVKLDKSIAVLTENWEKIFRLRPLSPTP